MISTRNLATNFDEVPTEWIWSYYCNMWDVNYDGTNYTIYSVFNKENTPSMKIFYKDGKYWFKDFSSGYSGDEYELVKCLVKFHTGNKLNFYQVKFKILEEYNHWNLEHGDKYDLKISDFKRERSYKVHHKKRLWNELDKKYWTSYYIGSRMLDYYNVIPLSEFTLESESDGFTITGEYIYGYFNNTGELVKIYQPMVAKKKFIYVKQYLQGSDQMKGNPYLIIQSGLKDIMAFKTMKLITDDVAADSENTMIPQPMIKRYISEYEQVLIMFDNDEAGHKSAIKYMKLYPQVKVIFHCTRYKDVADIVKAWGVRRSREYFVPLIDKVLNGERIFINNQPVLL